MIVAHVNDDRRTFPTPEAFVLWLETYTPAIVVSVRTITAVSNPETETP